MKCASQEKIKDPDQRMQLARAVSIAGRGCWQKGNLLALKCIDFCKSFIVKVPYVQNEIWSEREKRKKTTTLEKLLVRTRKLPRMALDLWETQLQVPNLIQTQ